jgi:hypothetical protein
MICEVMGKPTNGKAENTVVRMNKSHWSINAHWKGGKKGFRLGWMILHGWHGNKDLCEEKSKRIMLVAKEIMILSGGISEFARTKARNALSWTNRHYWSSQAHSLDGWKEGDCLDWVTCSVGKEIVICMGWINLKEGGLWTPCDNQIGRIDQAKHWNDGDRKGFGLGWVILLGW